MTDKNIELHLSSLEPSQKYLTLTYNSPSKSQNQVKI